MIKVLIVDDSITQREILRRLLEQDSAFTVVGEARDGKEAVSQVKQHAPDVVLMDLHMPEMDGIEATRQIMHECPVPIVIVSATLKRRDVDLGLQALEAGAVSVVAKPPGAAILHLKEIAPTLREELLAAAQARIQRRLPRPQQADRPRLPAIVDFTPADVVGICASTGGPPVLVDILAGLPQPFPLPILLVQHISAGFEEGFASWLATRSGHAVRIAADVQRLEPGVWLAPSGKHLTVSSRTLIGLTAKQPGDIHCPSGNPLFRSLAKYFGARAAGVQLTGMGDDGAQGLLELHQAGGQTIIQDEASCLIWGMPKAAAQLGAARHQLPPARIAAALSRMAGTRRALG
jgi:two-component system chemotaxis response regulator CheB